MLSVCFAHMRPANPAVVFAGPPEGFEISVGQQTTKLGSGESEVS